MAEISSHLQGRYPPELPARAVRPIVAETAAELGDRDGGHACRLPAGIGPESVRVWVRQAEVDREIGPA